MSTSNRYQSCIDACNACAVACNTCFAECLKEADEKMTLPLKSGVLSFVQNVDKELRNGGKASACGIYT